MELNSNVSHCSSATVHFLKHCWNEPNSKLGRVEFKGSILIPGDKFGGSNLLPPPTSGQPKNFSIYFGFKFFLCRSLTVLSDFQINLSDRKLLHWCTQRSFDESNEALIEIEDSRKYLPGRMPRCQGLVGVLTKQLWRKLSASLDLSMKI